MATRPLRIWKIKNPLMMSAMHAGNLAHSTLMSEEWVQSIWMLPHTHRKYMKSGG
ncbi:hypothetical protein D3C72_2370810 [compost metagenome]